MMLTKEILVFPVVKPRLFYSFMERRQILEDRNAGLVTLVWQEVDSIKNRVSK